MRWNEIVRLIEERETFAMSGDRPRVFLRYYLYWIVSKSCQPFLELRLFHTMEIVISMWFDVKADISNNSHKKDSMKSDQYRRGKKFKPKWGFGGRSESESEMLKECWSRGL